MANDLQHFRKILLESSRGIFGEPFGRQTLGSETERGFSRRMHRSSHEDVRHFGHARDAVAKGKTRSRLPHEEFERGDSEKIAHRLSQDQSTEFNFARRTSGAPPHKPAKFLLENPLNS